MTTHDPRQATEDLRNHLAMHDRRLSFLFGAGTSSAVNIEPDPPPGGRRKHEPLIPGIDGLTESCRESVSQLGEGHASAWQALAEQCQTDGRRANVEGVLSKVRVKIEAIGEGETLVGLDRANLVSLEDRICATIAKTVSPEIPECTPHNKLASWVKKVNRTAPIEVFTTNYDLLFEVAFETARVPVFDGFVGTHQPFFYPECLDDESLLPTPNWIRLWKLHGSVNWVLEDRPEGKRIIRTAPTESGELILPSLRKYDESRKQPYMGYMDRLTRILNSEHALLVTCGYSFGDEHINAILYGALENCSTTNIIALQFQDLDEKDDLVNAAMRHSNLTAIGPNGGVISGNWGLWQLSQPVDNKTCSFMDTAFDSNAQPEEKGSPAAVSPDLMGRMRIGDFNWFCRFLGSMGVVGQ
jgi:SIR2-like protein